MIQELLKEYFEFEFQIQQYSIIMIWEKIIIQLAEEDLFKNESKFLTQKTV